MTSRLRDCGAFEHIKVCLQVPATKTSPRHHFWNPFVREPEMAIH